MNANNKDAVKKEARNIWDEFFNNKINISADVKNETEKNMKNCNITPDLFKSAQEEVIFFFKK